MYLCLYIYIYIHTHTHNTIAKVEVALRVEGDPKQEVEWQDIAGSHETRQQDTFICGTHADRETKELLLKVEEDWIDIERCAVALRDTTSKQRPRGREHAANVNNNNNNSNSNNVKNNNSNNINTAEDSMFRVMMLADPKEVWKVVDQQVKDREKERCLEQATADYRPRRLKDFAVTDVSTGDARCKVVYVPVYLISYSYDNLHEQKRYKFIVNGQTGMHLPYSEPYKCGCVCIYI